MDVSIMQLIKKASDQKASDIHITIASPPMFRVNGKLIRAGEVPLSAEDTEKLVREMLRPDQMEHLEQVGEVDLSYSAPRIGRYRVNAYKQRSSYGMALRVINMVIPSMQELRLPEAVVGLCKKKRGLILVTGPTGSGKSTTLASMIDYMNHYRNEHIITIEDPIEYLHRHNTCIINQREVGGDTQNFANALRASLRQDPDIILVGEMRDLETISIAMTAAETGHLVLSTVHTVGAVKTVDRIIDVFPPHQQQQVRVQMATIIEAVISQQILPKANGQGRIAAFEVMTGTPAIRNLIREGKTHQIQTMIQTGSQYGMQTMDSDLMNLYRSRRIDKETLEKYIMDEQNLRKQMMGGIN